MRALLGWLALSIGPAAGVSGVAPDVLAPGNPIEQTVSGEAHEYAIALARSQFLRVVVEQIGVDVVVTSRDPAGREILKIDRPNGSRGNETISILAARSGSYAIRVEPLYGSTMSGRYRIGIAELRSSRPEDRDRLAAERDVAVGQQLQGVGRMPPALAMYDDAVVRYGRLGDAREQSVALMLAGIGHGMTGDLDAAFDLYAKAQAAAKRAADPQMEARVLCKWGTRETFSERPASGFERLQACIQEAHGIGDWETEMEGFINAGYAAYLLGRYQTGLECDERALALARAAKYPTSEAWAQFGFGFNYFALSEPEKSIRAYSEALRLWRELKSLSGEAVALQGLSLTYWSVGAAQKAYDAVVQTLPVVRALHDRGGEGLALQNLGLAEAELGRKEIALQHHREAYAIWDQIGDSRRAFAIYNVVNAVQALGQTPRAGETWQDALEVSRRLGNRGIEALTLSSLARSELSRGDLASARRDAEEAVDLLEAIRGEVLSESLRSSFLSTRQDLYAVLVDVLLALDRVQPNAGYGALAFAASERGRVRALLEEIVEARLDLRADLPEDLRRREEELDHTIRRLQSAPPKDESARAAAEFRLAETEEKWEQLLAEMRRRSPRYAALRYPEPISFERAGALLDPETAMVSYSVGSDRVLAMVLTKGGLDVRRLGIRPEELRERVENYVGLLAKDDTNRWTGLSAEIYRKLIAPWRDGLPAGVRRLVIVPDDVLHSLPFEALERPGSRPRRLVEDFVVSYAPSATVLAELSGARAGVRTAGPIDMLVVADPDVRNPAAKAVEDLETERFDLSPLPNAAAEARTIGRFGGPASEIDVGAMASEARIKGRSLERFGVLHFATHALLSRTVPSRSALLLAADGGSAGLLTAREIHRLRLQSDLVVLSGCQTAQGRILGGEGVQSLARAFFHAGARSLVASLWDVGDRRTAPLMTSFYRRLAAGATKAEALREAKLEMLRENPNLGPRYWAPFVLIGEPNARVPLHEPGLGWPVAAAAVFVGGASWALMRRQRRARSKAKGPSFSTPAAVSTSTVQK